MSCITQFDFGFCFQLSHYYEPYQLTKSAYEWIDSVFQSTNRNHKIVRFLLFRWFEVIFNWSHKVISCEWTIKKLQYSFKQFLFCIYCVESFKRMIFNPFHFIFYLFIVSFGHVNYIRKLNKQLTSHLCCLSKQFLGFIISIHYSNAIFSFHIFEMVKQKWIQQRNLEHFSLRKSNRLLH